MRGAPMTSVLVTGGSGFLGSFLCEQLLERGHEVLCVDNFFTGTKRISPTCSTTRGSSSCGTTSRFHFMSRPNRSSTSRARPRRSTISRTRHKPPRRAYTARSTCSARQACRSADLAGLDERGLRRSADASADGRLLGSRQSDRPARLLRRRQALRRDAVLRLPATARLADQGDADLQHLWPADAPERRAGGFELHRPGAAGRADHDLRRRLRRRARSATWTI